VKETGPSVHPRCTIRSFVERWVPGRTTFSCSRYILHTQFHPTRPTLPLPRTTTYHRHYYRLFCHAFPLPRAAARLLLYVRNVRLNLRLGVLPTFPLYAPFVTYAFLPYRVMIHWTLAAAHARGSRLPHHTTTCLLTTVVAAFITHLFWFLLDSLRLQILPQFVPVSRYLPDERYATPFTDFTHFVPITCR